MALSFSFPTGKAKKSLAGESSVRSGGLIPGPKSWKSFPSLSFFKETTSKTSVNPSSKLPVRTLAAAAFTSSKVKSSKRPSNLEVEFDKRQSLPDVTDTESPSALVGDTPRDLLAQLESLAKQAESLKTSVLKDKHEIKMDEKDGLRKFDDNGNPCQSRKNSDSDSPPKEFEPVKDDFPRCFIDASELTEESYTMDEHKPAGNTTGGTSSSDPCNSTSKTEDVGLGSKIPKIGERKHSVNSEGSVTKKTSVIRPRVPVSKSYPDIIQTTFNSDEKEMTKDNSDLESLVADSLENLAPTKEEEDKPFKAFEKPPPPSSGIGILSDSALMTESQMSGLYAEKPPEAWVIDLNSLSLDSELESNSKRSQPGSNSNSLAFFVNIDKEDESARDRRNSGASSNGPEKKIFSMFVDIEGNAGGSKIPKSQKVVNKPVQNVMETSTGSIKSQRRFPSPIFQHKAAAEAARKAARLEWEKQREKYYDSLEPTNFMAMMPSGTGTRTTTNTTIDEKEDPTMSNRSSLHVANVLEGSFTSSFISSMETSQPGELEICQGGPCFKLGKDLLRMFQDGINTDVNISVNGKWIQAHKCILASRSQYFAAILSGHWVEKAGNTINLDGFSYSVVQFTLYHIYSGTNEIPDTIDLLELASLTDLLGLEGLRENISQTFRVKFCHNFHRPCTGCITGVLECFPIATTYGMDELHRKMIKWICKHFVRIWPTKGFANLGDELIDKCLRYSINHLSVDNILDHTLGCDQLSTTMPTLRWTEIIFNIVSQLSEECVQFIGENLSDVLQSRKFLQFGKGQAWNISRIEGTFMQSMTLLKPDVACLSHTALNRLIELGTETIDEVEWSTSFVDFLKMLRDEIERYLLANASKAVLSKCWEELGPAVRKKICSSSFVGFDKFGNKIVKNTGAATNSNKKPPMTKERSTGNAVLHREKSLTKPSNNASKQGTNATTPTSAKIASVRPMPQKTQEKEVKEPIPVPKKLSSTGRTLSAGKSGGGPSGYSDCESRSTSAKSKTVERDQSFSRRSTASPTSSASRTPVKPLTPSVQSKPSPLTCYDPQGPKSSTTRATSARKKTSAPPKPVEPPKKTFLSNSAKAAAVSKPILKPRKTPTSSVSSLNSVTSQGTTVISQPSSISNRNRTPIPTQNTRFLSSTQSTEKGTFSARSSFSNVERPSGGGPREVRSKVDSNSPTQRRNTYGQSQTTTRQMSTTTTRNTTTTATRTRPTSSNATGTRATSATVKKASQNRESGHSSMPQQNHHYQPDSLNDSYSKDSLMSKSTIETESGEVKMRTLAEIGRSSTFSKDEPTILGKMDGSTYSQIDYDEYE